MNKEQVGLCVTCRSVRIINSARGSAYFLCERSKTDAQFVKYPALPVIVCEGYEKKDV